MDVNSGKTLAKTKAGQQMQQDQGIAAARQTKRQRFIRSRSGGDKVTNPIQQLI